MKQSKDSRQDVFPTRPTRRYRNGGEARARQSRRPASSVLTDISERTNNLDKKEEEDQVVQICFDFTKGRCARRNCKFSHDFEAIVKYNSKEQGICFDFLRGECNRGPLCRFSHDLTNVMKQWASELRGGERSRQTPCGICYDFVRGQCPRGKKCKFSHDLREIALATSRHCIESTSNTRNVGQSREIVLTNRSSIESSDSIPSTDLNNENRSKKSAWMRPEGIKSKMNPSPDAEPRRETALCNIRARQLLGGELCRALGIPALKSSLVV